MSCRIQLSLQGVEWFMYNRTAAYDNIVAQMEPLNRSTSRASFSERLRPHKSRQGSPSLHFPEPHISTFPSDTTSSAYPSSTTKRRVRVPTAVRNAFEWLKQQLPNLDPKDLLPLGIEVNTGSIIMGNPSTPTMLVAEFRTANGTFGVVGVGAFKSVPNQRCLHHGCSPGRSLTCTSNC